MLDNICYEKKYKVYLSAGEMENSTKITNFSTFFSFSDEMEVRVNKKLNKIDIGRRFKYSNDSLRCF